MDNVSTRFCEPDTSLGDLTQCQHLRNKLNITAQHRTGCSNGEYVCVDCGAPLVFCVVCMGLSMERHTAQPEPVHAYPSCDGLTFITRSTQFNRRRRSTSDSSNR